MSDMGGGVVSQEQYYGEVHFGCSGALSLAP